MKLTGKSEDIKYYVAFTVDNKDCTSKYTGVNVNWRHSWLKIDIRKISFEMSY